MASTVLDRITGLGPSVAIKAPCRLATTANIALLTGLLTVDGSVTAEGDRILVKTQTDQTQNGIWIASVNDWARAADGDDSRDFVQGTKVYVFAGATQIGDYQCTTSGTISPGSSVINFSGTLGSVTSVFGRGGAVSATAGDYPASKITNDSSVAGAFTKDALNTLLAADAAIIASTQPLDADLTTIATLTATTNNFMQAKGSAWASRTIAQVMTDLGLTGTNSGDQTITLTGDVTGSGTGSFAATIAAAAVTLAKLANIAAYSFIGNNTISPATPVAMTGAQATALLSAMVGDSGTGGTKGLVPAPAAGDATRFLRGDGVFVAIPGGGDALVGNPLSQFAATTSAQLAGVLSDETGSGAAVFGTAPTIVGGSISALTTFGVRSTGAAFDLRLASSEVLTANRTLSIIMGDTARTLTLGGNPTINGGTHSGTNTGDQTITLTGNVTGSGSGSFATTIAAAAVTLAMQANLAASSFMGNNTGSPATPIAMTVAQAKTLLAIVAADLPVASSSDWRANTASKILQTDNMWTSAALVTLTDAATIAVDLSTGINFTVTLGGNRTLGTPSNTKVGQSGIIYIVQDGTGTRTLALGSNWKTSAAAGLTLSTAINSVDRAVYFVRTSTHIDIDVSLNRS